MGCPEDEYDQEVSKILPLLTRNLTIKEIAEGIAEIWRELLSSPRDVIQPQGSHFEALARDLQAMMEEYHRRQES